MCLACAKFLRDPRPAGDAASPLPEFPRSWRPRLERELPTLLALADGCGAALKAHERFEAEVGGGSLRAWRDWLLSGLKAALYWVPAALLGMLAGAVVVSPFKLISGGLGLAGTPEGQWLLRQSWPKLLAKVCALDVLSQAWAIALFLGLRLLLRRWRPGRQGEVLIPCGLVGACYLAFLLAHGFEAMKAAPLLGIQLALLWAFVRTGTLLVPAAVNVILGVASLYSARMVVLLTADLGSIDSLPGIPGAGGVLAAAGLSLGLFAVLAASRSWGREGRRFLAVEAGLQWEALRSPGPPPAAVPRGLLWGIGVYLASYLSYYAVHALAPVAETVPPVLKQTLLMPFDMLVYVFIVGAALEEVVFRYGLFSAIADRFRAGSPGLRFWPAALGSAVVFSGFHFVDWGFVVRFLGVSVSKLVASMMMVYGFSWAGFAGRVAAGLVLALLYHRSGALLVPIIAHFTSNLLEAVGLRWGLAWLLAAVAGIFALQLVSSRDSSRGAGAA